MNIKIDNKSYEIKLRDTPSAQIIRKHLPIESYVKRWGDEIYIYVDIDIPLESDAKEVFNKGDIVYWRSQKNSKKAIAFFFGNTPAKDGKQPRAVSSSNLLGSITNYDIEHLSKVKEGDKIKITNSKSS